MTGVSSFVCFVLPSPPSAGAGWTVLGAGGCVQFAGVGGGGGAVGEMMTIYCVTLHSGRMAGHTRYRYFVYYPYRYFIACSDVSLTRVGKFKVQVV